MNDKKLRFELSEICKKHDSQAVPELNDLKNKYQHNILFIRSSSEFPEDITGYEYALGLANSNNYLQKIKKLRDLGFYCACGNSFFMAWIADIKKLLIPVNKKEITGGELIIYYESTVKHAGIVKNKDTIRSKWGTSGMYEHGILEIPIEYGENYCFFLKPNISEIEKYFDSYLNELALCINSLY